MITLACRPTFGKYLNLANYLRHPCMGRNKIGTESRLLWIARIFHRLCVLGDDETTATGVPRCYALIGVDAYPTAGAHEEAMGLAR